MSAAFFIAVLVLVSAAVLFLIRREQVHKKKLRLLVRKLYGSRVFDEMKPFIKAARRLNVEEITVDKTGVTLKYMNVRDGERCFLMRRHGFPYLTADQQEAMRSLLEDCLPSLAQRSNYRFTLKPLHLLDGTVEYAGCYTISRKYKAFLNESACCTRQNSSW